MKKKEKIFIVVSITFWIFLILIYSYRFMKYYKLEHENSMELVNTLYNHIIQDENITKQNETYIFKGKIQTNYVRYSGILFRIVKVNGDKTIELITDDIISSIVFGEEFDYSNSYVRDYLNNYENQMSFINMLNSKEEYLVKKNYCVKSICKKEVEDYVGLLNYSDYVNSSKEGFLNISKYWWLSNTNEDGIYYVTSTGEVSSKVKNGTTYYSYGVRPVITLKENLKYISGDGTINNPYIIDYSKVNVGSYIEFSNYLWKIIGINDFSYKLILESDYKPYFNKFSDESNIYDIEDSNSLAYYLNTSFYNSLKNKDEILEGTWYVGSYNESTKYDYRKIFEKKVKAKIGLASILDPFIFNKDDFYSLIPASEDMIYVINSSGVLKTAFKYDKENIRPVIYISNDFELIGDGTIENPYKKGD